MLPDNAATAQISVMTWLCEADIMTLMTTIAVILRSREATILLLKLTVKLYEEVMTVD